MKPAHSSAVAVIRSSMPGRSALTHKSMKSASFSSRQNNAQAARAGKAEAIGAPGVAAEDECIPERVADRAGLDICTLRCDAIAAPLIPIFEHLPA